MELYFSLSGLFNAVASTLLGLLVFFKNRQNRVNQTFAFFCLAVAAWSYAYMFWPIAKTKEGTLFWFQLLHIGANFAPIAYLHFVATWLELSKKRMVKIVIIVGYFLAAFFASLVFSNYFISDMVPKFSMKFWAVPGVLYPYYLVFFFGYAIYSSYLLIVNYNKASGVRRSQMKYILAGMVLAFAGGSTNYPLWYNINFPPYGNILASSYVILSAYAIIAHRLMDIKLVMRKSTVYLASVLIIAVPAGLILYFADRFYPESTIAASLAVLILGVSVFPPIRNFFYRLANKYFFSSLYDSGQVISFLSDKLRSTLEVAKIYSYIGDTLKNTFHAKAIGILTYEEKIGGYDARYSDGFNFGEPAKFPSDAVMHKKFSDHKVLVVEELKKEYYAKHSAVIDLWTRVGIEILAI